MLSGVAGFRLEGSGCIGCLAAERRLPALILIGPGRICDCFYVLIDLIGLFSGRLE